MYHSAAPSGIYQMGFHSFSRFSDCQFEAFASLGLPSSTGSLYLDPDEAPNFSNLLRRISLISESSECRTLALLLLVDGDCCCWSGVMRNALLVLGSGSLFSFVTESSSLPRSSICTSAGCLTVVGTAFAALLDGASVDGAAGGMTALVVTGGMISTGGKRATIVEYWFIRATEASSRVRMF